jgi:glycosyltransferase involved in cell wall biosynthesis
MRILVASSELPWPLNAGGNTAQFGALKCLRQDHEFTLVCPVYDAVGLNNAKDLQGELPEVQVRAVFCGESPRPMLKVIAQKMMRVAQELRYPRSAIPPVEDLKPGYYFDPLPAPYVVALQEELAKGKDLCQLEFMPMLSLGTWLPRHIPSLFVHHQVHFIYSRRFLEARGSDPHADYVDKMWQAQEIAYLQSYQGIIAFSEEDKNHLLPYIAPEKLFVSPFPLPPDIAAFEETPPGFDGRFIYLASGAHSPNRDALGWLLAEIWPTILQQMPSAQLVVIGEWSEAARAEYTAPGVTFSGFVKDLASVLRGGIMLVPLRIGSGLRVKIMAAMAQAVPVISTSVGSEGLLLENGQDLLLRDDSDGFAAAAVQIATDPALWMRLAENGRAAISRHYSPEQVRRRRNEIYASLTR